LTPIEEVMKVNARKRTEICARNSEGELVAAEELVFPNLTPEDMIEVMAPAVILTSEFDYNRKMAEELAEKFMNKDRLLEYGCLRGSFQSSYAKVDSTRSNAWFKAIADAAKAYL
jgi:hypothetical protein